MQVDVQRTGRRFDATAEFDLPASAATVWSVITDYPALPNFMPGIRSCRVVERKPVGADGIEHLVVEQLGEFRFLMFTQAINVRLAVMHQPLKVAEAKAERFDLGALKDRVMERFEGRYTLHVSGGGRRTLQRVRLRYDAIIQLRVPPPPALGAVAVRHNLSAQLEAIVREVARRTLQPSAAAAAS